MATAIGAQKPVGPIYDPVDVDEDYLPEVSKRLNALDWTPREGPTAPSVWQLTSDGEVSRFAVDRNVDVDDEFVPATDVEVRSGPDSSFRASMA